MLKFLFLIFLLCILSIGAAFSIFAFVHRDYVFAYIDTLRENNDEQPNEYIETILEDEVVPLEINYQVFIRGIQSASFTYFFEAVAYAEKNEYSAILNSRTRRWMWDNHPNFVVIQNNIEREFYNLLDAIAFAKEEDLKVIHRPNRAILWQNIPLANSINLDVPVILQNPTLPRGCSVVSLAIVLNYAGINIDKMQLVDELYFDPTPRQIIDNQVHFGNPYRGFVGDMFSLNTNGLGVYYLPIFDLMQNHMPYAAINITGASFEILKYFINQGSPVWIMTNAQYRYLPDSYFETWITDDGPIQITRWMHAVVVTGYDDNYIYISDPLGRHYKRPRLPFIEAFEQMGSQALTYMF